MRCGLMVNAGIGQLEWDWTPDGLLWPTLKVWNSQFLWWKYEPEGQSSFWITTDSGPVRLTPGDGRWVLYAPTGHNHGWLYGLIRALGKLWLDRVFAQKDAARASEKYSLGILLGRVPSDASKSDKQDFVNTVTNMPNETFVLLPQGEKKEDEKFDLEMMETDAMTHPDFFDKRLHRLDTNIAVCLLGQNLSTEIGGASGSGGGSRAAAQVHDNVRGDYTKADDEIWATMVRTQISTPIVRNNFGHLIEAMGRRIEEFVPIITHKVEPAEDLEKKSKSIANIGSAIPNLAGTEADIHALLEQYGVPTMDVKETPDGASPGADVNERPPSPLLDPTEDRPAQEPNPATTEPQEALPMSRTSRTAMKPGQRKGRVVADELVDAAKAAAVGALAARRKALLHICLASKDFAEMKERIRALYWDAKPTELRGIMEKALATSHLLGRMSAAVDHEHA
jgi:phage gp29-like protein